jgi:L-2,4-diaminobutyric acid acetyltransferase
MLTTLAEPKVITFRSPHAEEGTAMWQLVKTVGVLDLNSEYAYMLMARHFCDTSIVAEEDDQLLGFVTGYIPPNQPRVLFIWQVGVVPQARGRGLASRMIKALLDRADMEDVLYIETTVTPSNQASTRLFERLAEKMDAPLAKTLWFPKSYFYEDDHEGEVGFRIGPL